MAALASLKKAPAQAVSQEQAYKVEILRAQPENVPVVLTGFGEARSIRSVVLSAEVSGTVIAVHPRLNLGEIIPEGDVLFQIDPRDSQTALAEADAQVAQLENTAARLEKEWDLEKRRLSVLQRTRDLALAEFQRLQRLYDESKVGTRSGVEAAEKAYNQALDQLKLLEQSVAVYPVRLREARAALDAARAQRERTLTQLARCTVKAPFTGRITAKNVEHGQFLNPGTPAVTLADDSILEIHVPLDSDDARRWLLFEPSSGPSELAWFHSLRQVPCTVRWSQDPEGHAWEAFSIAWWPLTAPAEPLRSPCGFRPMRRPDPAGRDCPWSRACFAPLTLSGGPWNRWCVCRNGRLPTTTRCICLWKAA